MSEWNEKILFFVVVKRKDLPAFHKDDYINDAHCTNFIFSDEIC